MPRIERVHLAVVQPDLTLRFMNIAEVKNHCLPLQGQIVEVTIAKKRKRRTDNQNAYYWAVVIKKIADKTGYDGKDELEQLHEFLKQECMDKYGRLGLTRSTSSLSTEEFAKYVERVRNWARDFLHLYIESPDEVKETN